MRTPGRLSPAQLEAHLRPRTSSNAQQMIMADSPGLAFLRNAAAGTLYVIGTDVYLKPRTQDARIGMRRVATLAAEANALEQRIGWGEAHPLPSALEALDYALNFKAIAYTFSEVIPFLIHLATGRDEDADRRQALRPLLADLEEYARPFLATLPRPTAPPLTPVELSRLLKAPCAIEDGQLIPLLRPPQVHPHGPNHPVAAEPCIRRSCGPEPLEDIVRLIDQKAREKLARPTGALAGGEPAHRLVQTVRRIVELHAPVSHERYLQLYHDPKNRYAVHFSRGRSLLVCGPLRHYGTAQSVFVGVQVPGDMRQQLVTAKLRTASNPGAFWLRSGLPVQGGICAGRAEQFEWIRSWGGSDIEAFLHWLMAGRWLGTGRCGHLHARRALPHQLRATLRSRARRPVAVSSVHEIIRRL